MKKNRMMRLASILLVATLMSTCTISGTFAKYVTSAESTDFARVAEFGVRITANGETFKDTYQGLETGWTSADTVDGEGEDVVAPGTKGDMVSMELSGTPEVATRVSYAVEEIALDGWTLSGGAEYCPIIFNVEGETYGTKDTAATNKYDDVDDLKAALVTAVAGYKQDFAPNTNLASAEVSAKALSISWEWPFYVDADHDVKDTDLGNKAAAGNHGVIQIKVATTVTQID